MTDLFDPLPEYTREQLPWIPDSEVDACMGCNKSFGVFLRKHHCRQCGHVVCNYCSPNKRAIPVSGGMPVRICNSCYSSEDDNGSPHEWAGTGESVVESPGPVIKDRIHIGQVFVRIIEAIGLPTNDTIVKDSYVRIRLTGQWSHGQEWSERLQSVRYTKSKTRTLSPRWEESFVFNVFAPNAQLQFDVITNGQLSQSAPVSRTVVPLKDLMDQRRHNKWLNLAIPAASLQRQTASSNHTPRLHVLLHYRFGYTGEFFSHFAKEEPYVDTWPEFKLSILYSNFWVLLDELWPYLEVVWAIDPVLNWVRPTKTVLWLCLTLSVCFYIRWVPVLVHLLLIAFTIHQYLDMTIKSFATDDPVLSSRTIATEEEQDATASSKNDKKQYQLPSSFQSVGDKLTHATISAETKTALQDLQNQMDSFANFIKKVERLFNWEDPTYTTRVLTLLIISCGAHIMFPNQYLVAAFIMYLFIMNTVPYRSLMFFIRGIHHAIKSLMHQHRLRTQNDRESTKSKHRENTAITSKTVARREELLGEAAIEISKTIVAADVEHDKKQL